MGYEKRQSGGASIPHTSNLLIGDGSGGVSDSTFAPAAFATAAQGATTDSLQITISALSSVAGVLVGSGAGTFAPAGPGNVCPPVGSSTGIKKGDGSGALIDAVAGTDYVTPGGAGTVVADTGWTANQSGGDKTISVQNYDSTTLDGMTAGLNLVLAGFGTAIAQLADQVEDLTKKFQASETALAAALRPNA